MSKFEGFVKVINKKEGVSKKGAWFVESFKLVSADGVELEPWFQFAFNVHVPFQKDEYVSFEAESGEYGHTVTPGTGAKVANPPARVEAPPGASGGGKGRGNGGGGGSSSAYWEAKAKHEMEDVEPRIRFTSARNFALTFMEFLAVHDGLPSSEAKSKAGKALREKEYVAMLRKYTVEFYNDVHTLRLLDSEQDGGEVEVPPAADVTFDDVQDPQPDKEDDFGDDIPF